MVPHLLKAILDKIFDNFIKSKCRILYGGIFCFHTCGFKCISTNQLESIWNRRNLVCQVADNHLSNHMTIYAVFIYATQDNLSDLDHLVKGRLSDECVLLRRHSCEHPLRA